MPITIEIIEPATDSAITELFDYFEKVDERYSTYKPDSEISQINAGLAKDKWSTEMRSVLDLCDETSRQTNGYFDIRRNGKLDPSGLVKGWAIHNAAQSLVSKGVHDFYIEAGGDIQANGTNSEGGPWVVGIRNPFDIDQIIKVVRLSDMGIATSGTYIRGQHIYNPVEDEPTDNPVKSLTVLGPNVYEADRYATAAFAMGVDGIGFIEATPGLEGYMVDADALATYTPGFERYVARHA